MQTKEEKAKRKIWRKANPEKLRAYHKAYKKKYPEKIRVQREIYYETHKEKILTRRKIYYIANSEKYKARSKTWRKANPERMRVQNTAWSKVNPEKRRSIMLVCKYNITLKEFDIMLKAQGGRCAACGTTDWGHHGPCVDHDHTIGKVRGILCSDCNAAEGLLKSNPSRARALADYMEKNGND